jgi:hypothetical protein
MGLGSAAAVVSVMTAKDAQAGHDGTNVMHLGEDNAAPATHTRLAGERAIPLLFVRNTGTSGAIWAETEAALGAAITAFGKEWGVVGHGDGAGLQGFSFSGTGSGVAGHSDGSGRGVSGITNTGVGVAGGSPGSGTGVRGESQSGTGVEGHSDTGLGGVFSSNSGTALNVLANVEEGDALYVENAAEGGGVFARVQGAIAINGQATGSASSGGTGVHGRGHDTGVLAIGEGADSRAFVAIVKGPDGETDLPNGTALAIYGRSKFSTVGAGTVPTGSESVFVSDTGITAASHVSITLGSDPGSRSIRWVERDPGNGFTVHMTSASPNKRPATDFSYLVTEPV